MTRDVEDLNRRLLRARDAMDRAYSEPLDVRAVAAVAHISPAHFSRCFREVFGETPHRYLQRRRVERSMFLLRETERSVTDVCFDVGFTSLGTFSRTFRDIVGETPTGYRMGHGPIVAPHCVQLAAMRPIVSAGELMQSSSFGEAIAASASLRWARRINHTRGEGRDDHQAQRGVDLRPRQGGGARLLRQQARAGEGQ
ncbi:MAG TPA: helix-turn-helix transcriptional regulator [Candidatus Limnocylindrales bacterium]